MQSVKVRHKNKSAIRFNDLFVCSGRQGAEAVPGHLAGIRSVWGSFKCLYMGSALGYREVFGLNICKQWHRLKPWSFSKFMREIRFKICHELSGKEKYHGET